MVMEVSSQAMMLHRVGGICFDLGLFTNISPDHIGPKEHESFEEYLYYKSRLLTVCRTGVVNRAMDHYEEVVGMLPVHCIHMAWSAAQTLPEAASIMPATTSSWAWNLIWMAL